MKGQIARTANTSGNATPASTCTSASLRASSPNWSRAQGHGRSRGPRTMTGLPLLPLRANVTPYRSINILLLRGAAFDGGYR